MKLEIKRKVEQTEIVDIDLPYYFKHDLSNDDAEYVIYGKVERTMCVKIKISRAYNSRSHEFEIAIEDLPAAAYGCYMTHEHQSSEAEYLSAKTNLLEAIQEL